LSSASAIVCYDLGVRVLVTLFVAGSALASPPTPWSLARTPSPGPARAIGTYGAGCIAGAVALPLAGDGFRVAKPERLRVYGHPLLVAMIEAVGARLQQLHLLPLVVGDLGQPRGGPAPTGHASHQTGLDVDIWFAPPHGKEAVSMVDAAHQRPAPAFTPAMARLLTLVASQAAVERIFVNPILKRALCADATGERGWLRKLRPWWGHDDHFHVRLACPADSPACQPQAPLPPGDGCDALAWWFDAKAQADRGEQHQAYSSRVGAAPALPPDCATLIATTAAPAPDAAAAPASGVTTAPAR
jgi:penicillin-insensitive murein endopeptidase